jgi:hypothetical protein
MPSETTIIVTLVSTAAVFLYLKKRKGNKPFNEMSNGIISYSKPSQSSGSGAFDNGQSTSGAFLLPFPTYSNQ